MREIVSPQQAEVIVRAVAAGLLALGVVTGATAAALMRPRRAGLVIGAVVALAGVLVYALWLAYNAVIARFGLDSVKALLVNLGIFILVGLGYGVVVSITWRLAAEAGCAPRQSTRRP
jgi:hypothetical protein